MVECIGKNQEGIYVLTTCSLIQRGESYILYIYIYKKGRTLSLMTATEDRKALVLSERMKRDHHCSSIACTLVEYQWLC